MSADALAPYILADDSSRRALEAVRSVGPFGAYVAAGFIRNRVWNSFYKPKPAHVIADTDVVYFDRNDLSLATEQGFEQALERECAGQEWQVRNQARMHEKASDPPYPSISEALAHWPETATAVAVRLNADDRLEILAPFGLDDLLAHRLRPTPAIIRRDRTIFDVRVVQKGWLERWPNVELVN
ncbi:nucleotidyltransferase family protein [Kordiimonas sp.]|uniref:nucleotidyltransferase family protein n=1 Tax=Kordiimonas sp. TaxID=1970157 RepID=UPI003B516834